MPVSIGEEQANKLRSLLTGKNGASAYQAGFKCGVKFQPCLKTDFSTHCALLGLSFFCPAIYKSPQIVGHIEIYSLLGWEAREN